MAKTLLPYGDRSLAAFGIMLVITQDFYPIVLLAHTYGQNAAWLAAVMATLLTLLLTWPVAAVLKRMPQGSLIDLVQASVGRVGLILYAILIAGLFSYSGGLVLRETSEMALSAFFPHTPQTFATTALLLGSVYAAFGTSSSLVRFGRSMLGLILIAMLLITLGTMGWGNPRYLLPFWGPGPARLVAGAPAVSMVFGPVMIVLYLLADGVKDRPGLARWLMAVPLASGLVFAALKAILIMVYAYPMGRNIPYPLHEAARLVVGGRFFERIEGVWLLVWVLATMLYLGVLMYAAALMFTRAFGIPKTTTAVLPLATVFLTMAFFSPDQSTTIAWHKMAAPATFLLTLVLPLLLAVVAVLRRRRLVP